MHEKRIKTNGIELYVNEYDKTGETMIFIHCSSGNTAQWDAVIPYFQPHFHLITADMRGHGKSDKPETDYSLDTMASDVLGIMDALKVDKAHLVGSSMGAEIITSFAANYPDRVLSIVCEGALQNFFGKNGEIDIPIDEIEANKAERLERVKNRPIERYNSMEDMLNIYKNIFKEDWNKYWEVFFLNKFCKDAEGVIIAFQPKYLVQYCADFYSVDFGKYYSKITCPVLFLPDKREAEDERVMASLEHFRSLLKNCSITNIEDAEHASTMFINPEGYSRAIIEFINSL